MKIIDEAILPLKTVFGDYEIPAYLTLENVAIPKTTFKYLDINSCYSRCSLDEQYAYFSNPMEFNDPFDRAIPIAYHLLGESNEIFINYFSAKRKRKNPNARAKDIERDVLQLLEKCRSRDTMKDFFRHEFTSKSRTNLDSMVSELGLYCTSLIHDNILLWSHYANKHTGICLGMDTHKLFTSLKCGGARMEYGSYPLIVPFDEDDKEEVEKNYAPMFLSKAEFWEYEVEYRFSIFECAERKQYIGNCIESLILGSEISAESRDYAIRTCKAINPSIEIFEAKKIDFSFKLEILKVNL